MGTTLMGIGCASKCPAESANSVVDSAAAAEAEVDMAEEVVDTAEAVADTAEAAAAMGAEAVSEVEEASVAAWALPGGAASEAVSALLYLVRMKITLYRGALCGPVSHEHLSRTTRCDVLLRRGQESVAGL